MNRKRSGGSFEQVPPAASFAGDTGRISRWRVHSRTAVAIDIAVLCLATALLLVSVLDSVVSWPDNKVLISAANLEHVAGVLLIPSWIWMMVSAGIRGGFRTKNRERFRDWIRVHRSHIKSPAVVTLLGAALLVFVVIVVGFVIGGDKGSLRVLTGGVHQVSTGSMNAGKWTTVSPQQYQMWNARFVREDAFFGYLALFLMGFALLMLRLHRERPRPEGQGEMR